MKVSDFILNFLAERGVKYVFGIQGGFISPLFDAFHGRTDIKYICNQNEQASAMAADGYARFTGLGVAVSTSGPGATNLITGIGCSYFDSIPVLCITGQVPTGEAKRSAVRQRGFQETDIVSIVKPITKYARWVNKPEYIQRDLEEALWNARSGRPGPVLLDIPMDVLMAELPNNLLRFIQPSPVRVNISREVAQVVQLIADAKRPVIVYGAGARHARAALLEFVETTGIPCLPSWAALDLVPHDHPLVVSQFGVYGSRAGNLAVQNADLIIAIGTRLDGRMTGSSGFAPNAVRVVVDIDIYEAAKTKPDVMIVADVADFLQEINAAFDPHKQYAWAEWDWKSRIAAWKQKYPMVTPVPDDIRSIIQPLNFVAALNAALPDDAIIASDSGANLSWVHQAIFLHGTQRLFSAYGYSPMGYAVPAAIGAHYATGKPVVAICGDGAMQMNIQELQTLKHYNVPVKVFILNNRSYGIIKQFQEELFDGRYEATDADGGYSVPNFQKIAGAYEIPNVRVPNQTCVEWMVRFALDTPGPFICDVMIDSDARIFPKTRFGNPLENQHPLLPPDELAENMRNE